MAKRKKLYSFNAHPEHKARLEEWRDRWIDIALRTKPQDEEDRKRCRVAMRGLYDAAKLEIPTREVFCASPIGGAIAAVIASCIWWLRDHPERHTTLFGRRVEEPELIGSIGPAVSIAVRAAHGLPIVLPKMPATIDATHDATSDATHAATIDATHDATSDATRAATYAATHAATIDATHDATSAATIDATYAATRAAAYAATIDATDDATYAATYAATHAATIDATYAATDAATHAAAYAATIDATDDATRAATYDATSAATHDATYAATRDATYDLTPIVAFYLRALPNWGVMRNGGNQWAGWCAYLSFFREVARLNLPEHAQWIHYEQAAIHGGPRFMHAKFWIVSDFPTRICRDERHQPHSTTGPSIAWSDGWAAYYWRGIKVPREWIESPTTIDPKLALTHPNIEQRRCLAEIVGWERVLHQLDAKTVDRDPEAHVGELVEVEIDGNRERFLRVLCGTGREFALAVPPETKTAIEAQAWIHDLDVSVIRKLEART